MADLILSPELWGKIKTDLANGLHLREVANAYNLRLKTVERRAYKEGYSARDGSFDLSRVKSKVSGCVKGKAAAKETVVPAAPAPVFPLSSFIPPPILPDAAAVDFSAALVPHVQALIAAGLPGIEPPRNIAELKVLVELGRKLAGLDSKATSGKVQLFAPLRDVSRRGGASQVVVECSEGVQDAESADSIQEFEV